MEVGREVLSTFTHCCSPSRMKMFNGVNLSLLLVLFFEVSSSSKGNFNQIHIRPAGISDIVQLQALYRQQYPIKIQNEHKSIAKYVKKAIKSDLKDIGKYYLNPPMHGLWVAVDNALNADDQTVFGMIGIRENKSWKATKSKIDTTIQTHTFQSDDPVDSNRDPNFPLAYKLIDGVIDLLTPPEHIAEAEIMRFGVSPHCRRKGVGSALLEHAKQFCRDVGYGLIVASTMNVLTEAIGFYKTSGFVLEHSEPCGHSRELSFLRFSIAI